jgi:hypothetical protein
MKRQGQTPKQTGRQVSAARALKDQQRKIARTTPVITESPSNFKQQ